MQRSRLGGFVNIVHIALAQVGAPAVFDFFEHIKNTVGNAQVQQACGDINLVYIEGPGDDNPGESGQVHQGDDGYKRRCLEQEHHFIAVGLDGQPEGLGQQDTAVKHDAAHAAGHGGFNLANGYGAQRTTQDFRRISGGVQGQRENSAKISLAEENRQADSLQFFTELPTAEINQE